MAIELLPTDHIPTGLSLSNFFPYPQNYPQQMRVRTPMTPPVKGHGLSIRRRAANISDAHAAKTIGFNPLGQRDLLM
ncbi:MAG: hypothetical protein PHG21_12690, partial [Azoarcus sp.]|nr:hypothetical protein [Azoarcus sp.]